MGVIIKDGRGTGESLKVDTDGALLSSSITQTRREHVSEVRGNTFIWNTGPVDLGAGDTVLLVKNNSDEVLHINSIIISSDTMSQWRIFFPTSEVTVTGTTVVGLNMNTASSKIALASAASNETNNSGGDIVCNLFLSANTVAASDLRGIILGKNVSIAIDQIANTTTASVAIIGFFGE